jgi:hypothetical protein
MKRRKVGSVMASVLSATLALLPISVAQCAAARAETPRIASKTQTLFTCRTDRLFTLRSTDNEASKQGYAVSSRRTVRGEIRLAVDANNRTMTLFVQSRGEPTQVYGLSDVKQGSTPGSGASHKLDTTIRASSGDNVFTLFAEDPPSDFEHDAALQVNGRNTFLLACVDNQYQIGDAKGPYGITNIFILGRILSRGGLANAMEPSPAAPELWRYP